MTLENFRNLVKQVDELEATGIKFDLIFRDDNEYQKGWGKATVKPTHFEVGNLKHVAEVAKIQRYPVQLNSQLAKDFKAFKENKLGCVTALSDITAILVKDRTKRPDYPSLKFLPTFTNYANNLHLGWLNPWMITQTPYEEQIGDDTYRYVGTNVHCTFCVKQTDPIFKYLDKGFFIQLVNDVRGVDRPVLINELTLDTYMCLIILGLTKGAGLKHLQQECFLNANIAKVLRVKMEKELQGLNNANFMSYTAFRTSAIAEYERIANSGLLDKLVKGTIPSGTLNSIKLSKTKAEYEAVSLEAPDMLDIITKNLVFDDRTDIYTLVRTYAQHKVNLIEKYTFPDDPAKKATITEVAESFTVNGIPITIKRKTANTRRYVNDIPINIEELEQVAFRASCHNDLETYNKFVKAVEHMSLKWHDAIAKGVGVKIQDNLTADEYKRPDAPMASPKLKFRLKDDLVHLVIDDKRQVRVNLNDLLKKVGNLNRKTTGQNSISEGMFCRRSAAWARRELVTILKECCTFSVRKPVMVANKEGGFVQQVVDKKKVFEKVEECFLSDEDAEFIEKMARDHQLKAIEREKIFLAAAVKNTGAVLETYKGAPHYIVQGTLSKYAVNAATNEVNHFESGRHICIVEPGHQVLTGGDATAARLYALKNDKVTVGQIGTLRNA
jgi:hypothetical protein